MQTSSDSFVATLLLFNDSGLHSGLLLGWWTVARSDKNWNRSDELRTRCCNSLFCRFEEITDGFCSLLYSYVIWRCRSQSSIFPAACLLSVQLDALWCFLFIYFMPIVSRKGCTCVEVWESSKRRENHPGDSQSNSGATHCSTKPT